MRRIFSQARKELTQLVRDPLALALALVLPLILLLLLSTAISLTVHNLPIVIQDLDATSASRRFADAFRASVSFHVVAWPPDRHPEEALAANRARGVLIIPPNFGHDLARGDQTPVQLLVDATDSNTARIVQGYVNQVTNAFNRSSGGLANAMLVGAQVRLWYNPGRDSPKFYSPGIFVMGISMFPALLAALAMAKEGEQKTILQVYVSSISAHEFLLGKILAYMVIAGCEWVIGVCALVTVFGQHFAGDPTPLIVGSVLYAFCVSSFGTFVGAGIPNQAAAIQAVALGGFLLVFLLSGLIFPVENIPVGLRWVSNIVWGRYFIELVRDALLEGGGWPAMWFSVFMIALLGAVFYTLAWLSMRRMQVKA
ncbi:MAG TPA: ABC transporter permease [Bryobacteraceae bacterium]|nr:ABC transporter permease [Bryobacteraceae bacterium]